MKSKNENVPTRILGLMLYQPHIISQVSGDILPFMFPVGVLRQAAEVVWTRHADGNPITVGEFQDVFPALSAAVKHPATPSEIESLCHALREAWASSALCDGYHQAANIAANEGRIAARRHANGVEEMVFETLAKPDEKGKVLYESMMLMERYFQQQSESSVTGIDTGFSSLNDFTNGWQPGEINILAARPGMGKTTIALQSAIAAANAGHKALFFSCGDMPAEQLYIKAAAAIAGVHVAAITSNSVSKRDKERLSEGFSVLDRLPIWIYDSRSFSTTSWGVVDMVTKRTISESVPALVVVDYIQQLNSDYEVRDPIERISLVIASMKRMCLQLRCSAIIISQLSREIEKDARRMPRNSDLRGSGALEQDADRIFFAHRHEGQPTLVWTKNRFGGLPFGEPVLIGMNWLSCSGRYEWNLPSVFCDGDDAGQYGLCHSSPAMMASMKKEDIEIPF